MTALRQLGLEELGVIAVAALVFCISFVTIFSYPRYWVELLSIKGEDDLEIRKVARVHGSSGGR